MKTHLLKRFYNAKGQCGVVGPGVKFSINPELVDCKACMRSQWYRDELAETRGKRKNRGR